MNTLDKLKHQNRLAAALKDSREFGKPFIDFFAQETPLLKARFREEEARFQWEIEAPGMTKENLMIRIDGRSMLVSGKERESRNVRITRTLFHHTFRIPSTADVDKVEATCRNGVLTISIAKLQPKHLHKIIKVQGEGTSKPFTRIYSIWKSAAKTMRRLKKSLEESRFAVAGKAGANSLSFRRTSLPLLLLATALLVSSCHGKTNGQNASSVQEEASGKGKAKTIKPKITVNVNKHYDDKGNLVGFDSTYSSFYSNVQGDTARMDSLFMNFDRYFNTGQPSLMNKEFNSLFFRDSLMYPDFFHDDFFLKRYELNDPYLRRMMGQMDSIKNRFYEEQSRRKKTAKRK